MKNYIIIFALVLTIVSAFAGCSKDVFETAETTAATPNVTQNEAVIKKDTTSTQPVESQENVEKEIPEEKTEYFDADYNYLEEMSLYTPEFVLEGFYDGFIDCAPYITEIEITYNPYSYYGEVMCRIEGISKHQLKNIVEKSFDISMEATDFADGGYFALLNDDVFEVNKIAIHAYHDMVFLNMQEADFSMVNEFKLPDYYIEQLGENAYNYAPQKSILRMQKAKFYFTNKKIELSNVYSVPNENREYIVNGFIDGFSQMDGYYYVDANEWEMPSHAVRKSDGLTIGVKLDEYGGALDIVTTIQYKKLSLQDSSELNGVRSLRFEDLYNNVCTKIMPLIEGEIFEVNLSQYEEFLFWTITDIQEVADKSAVNAVITELHIAGFDDINKPVHQLISVEEILEVLGEAEVYAEDKFMMVYKDGEFAVRAYIEEGDESRNGGRPYVVCTIVEVNSPAFDNIEHLQILNKFPVLNLNTENEPLSPSITLKKENSRILFKLANFYAFEGGDFDSLINLYKEYFDSNYNEYEYENDRDVRCMLSCVSVSEIDDEIAYETRVFIGKDDYGDWVLVNAEIEEFIIDWKD